MKTISMTVEENKQELASARNNGFNEGYGQAMQYISDILAGAAVHKNMYYLDDRHKQILETIVKNNLYKSYNTRVNYEE